MKTTAYTVTPQLPAQPHMDAYHPSLLAHCSVSFHEGTRHGGAGVPGRCCAAVESAGIPVGEHEMWVRWQVRAAYWRPNVLDRVAWRGLTCVQYLCVHAQVCVC
jgi:hypothetical protein